MCRGTCCCFYALGRKKEQSEIKERTRDSEAERKTDGQREREQRERPTENRRTEATDRQTDRTEKERDRQRQTDGRIVSTGSVSDRKQASQLTQSTSERKSSMICLPK